MAVPEGRSPAAVSGRHVSRYQPPSGCGSSPRRATRRSTVSVLTARFCPAAGARSGAASVPCCHVPGRRRQPDARTAPTVPPAPRAGRPRGAGRRGRGRGGPRVPVRRQVDPRRGRVRRERPRVGVGGSTVPGNVGTAVQETTSATTGPATDLPPVTIPADSSPPTTAPGTEPSSVPGADGDLPLFAHLLVDVDPGGYEDFAVYLRQDQQ